MRLKAFAKNAIKEFPALIKLPTEVEVMPGRWAQWFGREAPLYVELGMGSGQMIRELARRHPENNYLGVEINEERIYRCSRQILRDQLNNCKLLRLDIEHIVTAFAPQEIAVFYITFPDPWPKKRHAKHRLTNRTYWEKYLPLLKKGGTFFFKTDDRSLFDFTLEELTALGQQPQDITNNLPVDHPWEDIFPATNYEERWRREGRLINFLRLVRSAK